MAYATSQNSGRRNREVAVRTDDLEALAGELFGTAWAHQERDVASGANEASAEIPAQRAGSDH
jgi:hypothetical protein